MPQTLCLGPEENRLCALTSGTSLKDDLLRIANHRHSSATSHPVWEAKIVSRAVPSLWCKESKHDVKLKLKL